MGARIRSWYLKAKDSAIGSSFDQHVVGGYRFLMRFYNPGDEIYFFGFSRGAYGMLIVPLLSACSQVIESIGGVSLSLNFKLLPAAIFPVLMSVHTSDGNY